jgi:hypothetical protein
MMNLTFPFFSGLRPWGLTPRKARAVRHHGAIRHGGVIARTFQAITSASRPESNDRRIRDGKAEDDL